MAPQRPTVGGSGELGVYGLRLSNIEGGRRMLSPASAFWPHLEVKRRRGTGGTEPEWLTETGAKLNLQNGGEIELERERERVTFVLPRPVRTAELIHPLLAPVGGVMAYWLERESFHAGGFVAGGKTWGILGSRGSGKSTTMARLALAGVPVVCDDLLVVEDRTAFAGPRAVDLRRDAAERLGVGEGLGVVGARERWRVALDDVSPETTLAGWVFLSWGERVELVAVTGSERLVRLTGGRGVNLPPRDPERLLDLATLPGWELRRPKGWRSLDDTVECLLETVG